MGRTLAWTQIFWTHKNGPFLSVTKNIAWGDMINLLRVNLWFSLRLYWCFLTLLQRITSLWSVIFVVCVFFFFFLSRYPKSLGVQGKAPASNGDNGVMISVGIPTYQPSGFIKLPNSFVSFHRSRDTEVLKRLFRISSLEITEPYLYSSGTNNYRPCIVIGVHVRISIIIHCSTRIIISFDRFLKNVFSQKEEWWQYLVGYIRTLILCLSSAFFSRF